MSLFDLISRSLAQTHGTKRRAPLAARSYRCRCERPVFFRNSRCLGCDTELGFDPVSGTVRALVPGPADGSFVPFDDPAVVLCRCANFETAGCNWMLPFDEDPVHDGLCRACRLNHTIPDLDVADNATLWMRIETAKRRLVAQLLALDLPVRSKVTEDPVNGLMFDFLRARDGGKLVLTGHHRGLITLNIEEADDAKREQVRTALREPHRTLLGHLRHEVGHYYWDRLIAGTPWVEPFRKRFGDERADYVEALKRNYKLGPAEDWSQRCVSAYASMHPWEDWAETWAHYLHMLDTLDTALSFGLEGDDIEIEVEPYGENALDAVGDPDAPRFLSFVNAWLQLTALMNELSRSMGQYDFYPFVLSHQAVAKLHFVHRVVLTAPRELGYSTKSL
jgi:hypothetical protein